MSLPPISSGRHPVHGDDGEGGGTPEQQPGLGLRPGLRRSEAPPVMDGRELGEEREREGRLELVLALPVRSLTAVVARMDAAVPRKARTFLPRAVPTAWWAYRIPAPMPPPPPPPRDEDQQPAKRCLHCDREDTPRWKAGPMGDETLCNACGVWYSTTGALPEYCPPASPAREERPIWEPDVPGAIYLVRRSAKQRKPPRTEAAPALVPRPGTTCLHCGSPEPPKLKEGPLGTREVCNSCGMRYKKGKLLPECGPVARQIPDSLPKSPIVNNSPPESPIWKPEARTAVYQARKPGKQRGRAYKKKAASAPGRRTKNRSCVHCGSSVTPQWREGPMGRSTLCNACGVRYKQGRLLPEYRPKSSPTFTPSEHASSHRRVLELHRKGQHPPPSSSPTFMVSKATSNHRPKLPQKRKFKEQHLQTPPPADDIINAAITREDHPIDTPSCPEDHPVNIPGSVNAIVDTPGSVNAIVDTPGSVNAIVDTPGSGNAIVDRPRSGNAIVDTPGSANVLIDTPGSVNALVDTPGGPNVLVDAPNSLDSRLLDGPSAPLIVESDEPVSS